MRNYNLEINESEVLAIVSALATADETDGACFLGSIDPIRYLDIADKIEKQMMSQMRLN